MLIIVAGSRWAGNAGRAAGWRAGTFGCGDANQAGGEGGDSDEHEDWEKVLPRALVLALKGLELGGEQR